MRDALALLKEHGTRWISVKDRLPDENAGQVLAIVNCGHAWYRMLAWHGARVGWISDDTLFRKEDGRHVTHWMPLPEPPKEVQEDV